MTAKTELLLYRMGWLAAKNVKPMFRNLEHSFERWAYENGFAAQVHRLEAQGLIESQADECTGKRLHRLTEVGVKAAAGPYDPEASWARVWDGKWCLFLFDIPEKEKSRRRQLTRTLAAAGCGCLQGSTWIAPSLPPTIEKLMADPSSNCSQVLLLHAESKGRDKDLHMVETAWNFEAIHQCYQDYLTILAELKALATSATREEFADWGRREIVAWRRALAADPLLPEVLLPHGYLGKEALHQRRKSQPVAADILVRIWPDH